MKMFIQSKKSFMVHDKIQMKSFRDCECGIPNSNTTIPNQQHPWHLLLTFNWNPGKSAKNHNCGGILVSRKHFLTALGCLEDVEKKRKL